MEVVDATLIFWAILVPTHDRASHPARKSTRDESGARSAGDELARANGLHLMRNGKDDGRHPEGLQLDVGETCGLKHCPGVTTQMQSSNIHRHGRSRKRRA